MDASGQPQLLTNVADFGISESVTDGEWHHVAISVDTTLSPTEFRFFIDGVHIGTKTASSGAIGTGNTRYGFLGVGSEASSFDGSKGPTGYFNGELGYFLYRDGAAMGAGGIRGDMRRGTGTATVVYAIEAGSGDKLLDGSGSDRHADLNGPDWNFGNLTPDDAIKRRTDDALLESLVQRLQSTGDLRQAIQHGSGFPVSRHHEEDRQEDGVTSVSFQNTYDSVPHTVVTPADGARIYSTSDSGSDQFHSLKTPGLDTQGFDELVGEIVISSTTTAIDDGFGEDPGTQASAQGRTLDSDGDVTYSNLEDANATPVDYTVAFDFDSTNLQIGDDLTLHIEVNDGADSSNWTEVATQTVVPGNSGSSTLTFNTGLGADYDIRARATASTGGRSWSITMHAENGSPPGVEYDRDDGSTVRTMSPNAGDNILWQAEDTN